MSAAPDKNVQDYLQQLFQARLQRRQALKVIGGTAAVTTLAACGVTPAPTPQPQVPLRTNQVMLRAKVLDLTDATATGCGPSPPT